MKVQSIGNSYNAQNQKRPAFGMRVYLGKDILAKTLGNLRKFEKLSPNPGSFNAFAHISGGVKDILSNLPRRLAEHNAASSGFFRDYETTINDIEVSYHDMHIANSNRGSTPENAKSKRISSMKEYSARFADRLLDGLRILLVTEDKEGIKATQVFGYSHSSDELVDLEKKLQREIEKAHPRVYLDAVEK